MKKFYSLPKNRTPENTAHQIVKKLTKQVKNLSTFLEFNLVKTLFNRYQFTFRSFLSEL